MISSPELTQKVFEYLNANVDYAVLRNYEGLPLRNNSRDIDIMVRRKEFLKKEKEIIKIILENDFQISTLYRSEKIITYVCANATKNVDLVQFDFFLNTSLFGIILINAETILNSKVYNGAVYHVSKEFEFLDKFLQMKTLNKPYPQKYNSVKEEMRQSSLIGSILRKISGCGSIEEFEKLTPAQFKRRKLWYNLKEFPFTQIHIFFPFWWFYIKGIFCYRGFSIGFTGPDGVGKTTVIDAVSKQLKQTYSEIEYLHFRPSLTPNLGDAAQKAKIKQTVDRNYSKPHRGGKTGKFNSLIRLVYYSFDYLLGYFLRVRPFLQRGSIVIFDRYYSDIIADSRRSRIYLNHHFLYGFGRLFIPQLNYNILLTADKDIILARKQELDAEGVDRINKKLSFLSKKEEYYLVNNNESPENAVREILSIIFEKQHQKNMKRLKNAFQ